MRATVVAYSDNIELAIGDTIEVIGFVTPIINGHGGYSFEAVWRDDEGYIWTIPTSAIRMLPNPEATERGNLAGLKTFLNARPQPVNAVGGPATVTPRGVR